MNDFICKILQIERKELEKTIFVFLFIFFVIFSYYLIKPSKDALFIHYMGAKSMPKAYILIPILTLLFLFLYDYFVRKLKRNTFGSLLMAFFISNLFTIWIMFKLGLKREAAYTLYIWSDVFSVAIVTLFWSITNDIYTFEGAKRVYGFIGIGAQTGGFLGSFITRIMSVRTETENLLLLASFFFIIIIFLIIKVDSIASSQEKKHKEELRDKCQFGSGKGFSEFYRNFLLIIRSRYLLYFTLFLCVMLMCSHLVNFQVGRVLENSIVGKNAKTVFFGNLYLWGQLLSIVFLLFAPLFYRYLRIFGTLYILPIVNLITIFSFGLFPALSLITLTKILDGSLKYGINQVTREMLYIPCTKEEKYRAKAVIDILFYRIAKIFSAILMGIFIALSIQYFNIIIIIILLLNLWVLYKLKEAFIKGLEDKIERAVKEHSEVLPAAQEYDHALFDENKIIKSLVNIIKDKTPRGCQKINPVEMIAKELPALAPAGTIIYHNRHIEQALLILSHFNEESTLYSLCVQYLNIALPGRARRYYSIILSLNISPEKILKLENKLSKLNHTDL